MLRSSSTGAGAMSGAGVDGETMDGAGATGGAMAPADEDQAWDRGPNRGATEVITDAGGGAGRSGITSSSADPSDTVTSGAGAGTRFGAGFGVGAAGTASAATWLDGVAVVTR